MLTCSPVLGSVKCWGLTVQTHGLELLCLQPIKPVGRFDGEVRAQKKPQWNIAHGKLFAGYAAKKQGGQGAGNDVFIGPSLVELEPLGLPLARQFPL